MAWLALLQSLARALALWLEIKVVAARYDLQRRIEADIAADENEILRLRAGGAPADHVAADRVRDRILRAQGIVAALPVAAPSAPTAGGAGGAHG